MWDGCDLTHGRSHLPKKEVCHIHNELYFPVIFPVIQSLAQASVYLSTSSRDTVECVWMCVFCLLIESYKSNKKPYMAKKETNIILLILLKVYLIAETIFLKTASWKQWLHRCLQTYPVRWATDTHNNTKQTDDSTHGNKALQ